MLLVAAALPLTPVLLLSRARRVGSEAVWRQRTHAAGILLAGAMLSALVAHQAVRHLVPAVLVGYILASAMLTLVLARVRHAPWISAAVAAPSGRCRQPPARRARRRHLAARDAVDQ